MNKKNEKKFSNLFVYKKKMRENNWHKTERKFLVIQKQKVPRTKRKKKWNRKFSGEWSCLSKDVSTEEEFENILFSDFRSFPKKKLSEQKRKENFYQAQNAVLQNIINKIWRRKKNRKLKLKKILKSFFCVLHNQ